MQQQLSQQMIVCITEYVEHYSSFIRYKKVFIRNICLRLFADILLPSNSFHRKKKKFMKDAVRAQKLYLILLSKERRREKYENIFNVCFNVREYIIFFSKTFGRSFRDGFYKSKRNSYFLVLTKNKNNEMKMELKKHASIR